MEFTDLKLTTDGIQEIEFCILFLYKKIDVTKIVKSAVYNGQFFGHKI